MANNPDDPFKKQLNSLQTIFRNDLLSEIDKRQWPDRIDYVASKVTVEGEYTVGMQSNSGPKKISSRRDLDRAASELYIQAIAELTGNQRFETVLSDDFRIAQLLLQFSELRHGLSNTETDVPPGEVLGRLITRNVKRTSTSDEQLTAAHELYTEATTPRELISELSSVPELAEAVETALPDTSEELTLTEQLAEVDLTTRLWDHQREALQHWIREGMNGYVNMATATGKTVLGLAAAAYAVDSGSLHPADRREIETGFDGGLPDAGRSRSDDVLIVTTDNLLGVQWSRLFQEHCHTPPEYTQIEDGSIELPWGTIDIRSANDIHITEADPEAYRLAIFDEVHNYSGAGWGAILNRFIESSCSVLALTGSATEEFESHIEDADQSFPQVGDPYTHREAISDGIVPDFSWTLAFTQVQDNKHLDDLRTGAEKIPQLVEYNSDGLKVPRPGSDLSRTNAKMQGEVAGKYETGTALAKTFRSIGMGPEAPTAELEQVANSLRNRTIQRLNLKTATDRSVELTRDAVSNERPVLILTQSHGESEQLSKQLGEVSSETVIKTIRRDQSADEQDDIIQQFDAADTSKKVLIADGKRIGQGIDIHSIEVGINIAQPGSGANTTLVQRLGRLLRDANGKETVEFYHLLGVQPKETVLPPDGESFVTNVASFFEQAVLPDTDGVLKPPGTMIDSESVAQSILTLEKTGVTRINASKQQSQMETAYISAIETTNKNGPAAVTQLEEKVTTEMDMSQRTVGDEDAGTETTITREVDIDPVLIGLIQEAVESTELSPESQSDVLKTALRPFLKEVATGKVEPETFASNSTCEIEFSADSTFEILLKRTSKRDSAVDSSDELVKRALFTYLDIDPADNTLNIPDYEELRLPIEAVLEDDRYPCETPGDVVEAALRNQFDI